MPTAASPVESFTCELAEQALEQVAKLWVARARWSVTDQKLMNIDLGVVQMKVAQDFEARVRQ